MKIIYKQYKKLEKELVRAAKDYQSEEVHTFLILCASVMTYIVTTMFIVKYLQQKNIGVKQLYFCQKCN